MQAIILAAGQSTRFYPLNKDHKSTYVLFGKPLIIHTLLNLQHTHSIDQALIIHAQDSIIPKLIKKENLKIHTQTIVQPQPLGTGNAFSHAIPYITQEFVLVWPDMVNAGSFIHQMKQTKEKTNSNGVFLGAPTDTPQSFGMIDYNQRTQQVNAIVEKPHPNNTPSHIKRVGVEILDKDFLEYYALVDNTDELAIVYAINNYLKDKKALVHISKSDVPILKYPKDLFTIHSILQSLHKKKHYVSPKASIHDSVQLKGKCINIEDNTTIEEDSTLTNCLVGEGCVVKGSTMKNCIIGDNVEVRASNKSTPFVAGEGASVLYG